MACWGCYSVLDYIMETLILFQLRKQHYACTDIIVVLRVHTCSTAESRHVRSTTIDGCGMETCHRNLDIAQPKWL